MSLSRRQILKLLALGVGGLELDIDLPLWVPSKTIFVPTQKQLEFFNAKDVRWYGIPYHQSNATTSQWLGFKRAFELVNLNDKDKDEPQ